VTTPPCFESAKQFRDWRRLNAVTKELTSICSDCTTAYRVLARREGRCESRVYQTMFFKGKDVIEIAEVVT
jgi:hypothetical protein